MHAVLVTVDIEEGRVDEATQILTGQVIPRVKAADGFVRGTWTRVDDGGGVSGRSMLLFKTEGDARVAAQAALTEGPPPGAPVSVRSVEVAEVVAEA
jgi:hypothetical protein